MSSLAYALPLPSVLLPYMYMDIPLEYIKQYHMRKERMNNKELPLAVVYARRNHPRVYGCTAQVSAYQMYADKVTILGVRCFRKNFSLHRYGRVINTQYLFDEEEERNVWVKRLTIVECLHFIARRHNSAINMREMRHTHTSEFSFRIASSQFFNMQDRYRLLKTRSISKRLDMEIDILNSRFATQKQPC